MVNWTETEVQEAAAKCVQEERLTYPGGFALYLCRYSMREDNTCTFALCVACQGARMAAAGGGDGDGPAKKMRRSTAGRRGANVERVDVMKCDHSLCQLVRFDDRTYFSESYLERLEREERREAHPSACFDCKKQI